MPSLAHTKPWKPDEYIYVGSNRRVYSHDEAGEMIVHLPGGASIRLIDHRMRDIPVTMPLKTRKTSFTRAVPRIV